MYRHYKLTVVYIFIRFTDSLFLSWSSDSLKEEGMTGRRERSEEGVEGRKEGRGRRKEGERREEIREWKKEGVKEKKEQGY